MDLTLRQAVQTPMFANAHDAPMSLPHEGDERGQIPRELATAFALLTQRPGTISSVFPALKNAMG